MVGHLREQVIIYNNAKRLGDIKPDKLQQTIDDFNSYTAHGGSMRRQTKTERRMDGMSIGWTSIDSATENVLKQEWSDDRGKVVIPIGSIKHSDVNRFGKSIVIRGKPVIMSFEYRPPRNNPTGNARWIIKTWKYK